MYVCLSGPPYSTPIVISRNLFMKSALGVSTTPLLLLLLLLALAASAFRIHGLSTSY